MIISLLFSSWIIGEFEKQSFFMSMSKSWTPEIGRGDTKRRSFYSALVYSAEAPMVWKGGGGMPAPSPLRGSLFLFNNFSFFVNSEWNKSFYWQQRGRFGCRKVLDSIHIGHEIIYLSYLISGLSCTFLLQLHGAQSRRRLLVKLRFLGFIVSNWLELSRILDQIISW